jgi:hypothetical protein
MTDKPSSDSPNWFKSVGQKPGGSSHFAAIGENPSPSRSVTSSPEEQTTRRFSARLRVEDSQGESVSAAYAHIQEFKASKSLGRVRLFYPRSVVDISTKQVGELADLLDEQRLTKIWSGLQHDSVKIDDVVIYDLERMPTKPPLTR